MEIRKLFRFENAHVVRNCSSNRCKYSIHGHSYVVEIILKANSLDNGQMVYDFGLLKGTIKDLVDSFDHATAFWSKDDSEYIDFVKKHSARWISIPVSPSAEQLSRVIFLMADLALNKTKMNNGESGVSVEAVVVHETTTGYAKAFGEDIDNPHMGIIDPTEIVFSDTVKAEWKDPLTWDKILGSEDYVVENPEVEQQVRD